MEPTSGKTRMFHCFFGGVLENVGKIIEKLTLFVDYKINLDVIIIQLL